MRLFRKTWDEKRSSFQFIDMMLPKVFNEICRVYEDRADLILAAWPEIIGPDFASMTQAQSFHEGVLTVVVRNSTLYSLLFQREKGRLLKNLREKFPKAHIKTINFRLG